ncbi:hypothetical protein HID58_069558, partial [Brassica napus]
VYVYCVTPSHNVTRSRLVYVDVCINAPDRAPVVSVLLASDQPIRPTHPMRLEFSLVMVWLSPALLHHWGSELLMHLVSQKARHALLCHRIRPLTWIRLQQARQCHPCGTKRFFPYAYAQ